MEASSIQTVADIRTAMQEGATAVEICRLFLDRIASHDGPVHAFTHIATDKALAQAATIDRRNPNDPILPLAGVPVAVKDNISTDGIQTTASSRILDGFVPPYDATVVERLTQAGAIDGLDNRTLGGRTHKEPVEPQSGTWRFKRRLGGRGRR